MIRILHITAHLGGGVGKALSGLVEHTNVSTSTFRHTIVCLEKNEKSQFIDKIYKCGGEVIVCPSTHILEKLMKSSDIVQLEWWNHPVTIKYLCSIHTPPIRLIVWSHNSGLHIQIIPKQLILASHIFIFTSPCSFENKDIKNLAKELGERVGTVPSSGGFQGLPEPKDRIYKNIDKNISVGYFGSLNFAKLHPQYINYLTAVDIPKFEVKIIGDLHNNLRSKYILSQQCDTLGKSSMLKFTGYVPDIVSELNSIDVLAYLLNPEHYGTTENALLETMAMGIVPIVLNNPAERYIVGDHDTGLIINSPKDFADAIRWLYENPVERQRLGNNAAKSVRERFSIEKMEISLNKYYQKILSMDKRKIVFSEIFGTNPVEWFLSCQDNKGIFSEGGNIHFDNNVIISHGLFEKRKGTVFHFSEYFPDNLELKLWADNLKSLL